MGLNNGAVTGCWSAEAMITYGRYCRCCKRKVAGREKPEEGGNNS